jgi:hypothetical protein
MKSKNVVTSTYPQAECREITSPSGSYYLIYDMSGLAPNMLGYDMESEAKAWDMAAEKIGQKMVTILEKE